MRPISKPVKKELTKDKFMESCCVPGCPNKDIEYNHAIIYAGRQLDKAYAIVPVCKYHHRGNNGTIFRIAKDWSTLWAITRGRGKIEKDCPKENWFQLKKHLENKLKATL